MLNKTALIKSIFLCSFFVYEEETSGHYVLYPFIKQSL